MKEQKDMSSFLMKTLKSQLPAGQPCSLSNAGAYQKMIFYLQRQRKKLPKGGRRGTVRIKPNTIPGVSDPQTGKQLYHRSFPTMVVLSPMSRFPSLGIWQ